jgi:hypothetical protein
VKASAKVVDHWFVTFDFAKRELRIVFNDLAYDPAILTHEMLRHVSLMNLAKYWEAIVGDTGNSGEYSYNGFK